MWSGQNTPLLVECKSVSPTKAGLSNPRFWYSSEPSRNKYPYAPWRCPTKMREKNLPSSTFGDSQIDKLCSSHAIEYQKTLSNECTATIHTHLTSTMSSEGSQTQKNSYCRIPFIKVQKQTELIYGEKSRLVVAFGHRVMVEREVSGHWQSSLPWSGHGCAGVLSFVVIVQTLCLYFVQLSECIWIF